MGRSRAALKASPIHFLKKKSAMAVAALTICDMCKALDKSMIIGDIRLVRKSGGRSGIYLAD
jgi:molybdenum cofactor biosynthesis enzyme